MRIARFGKSRAAVQVLLACTTLAGLSGCELFLGARTAERFPPPGRIVEIDGRKLQIDCRGTGSPTVVLESGGTDIYGSLTWTTIQDKIAASTRVCSYSRAGIMWSDSRRAPLDSEGTARDLNAALRLANEVPPFVMVGHSRGALYSLIFTDLFREDVAGLVLVEPRHPDMEARRAQAGMVERDPQPPLATLRIARALRWTGLPRAFSGPCANPLLTAQGVTACKAYFPHSLGGVVSEAEALESVRARAANVHDLGNRPVLVLTRQLPDAAFSGDETARAELQKRETLWRDLHAEMAAWSSRGERRIVPNSSHNMMLSQPQAVVDGVREVVALVRKLPLQTR